MDTHTSKVPLDVLGSAWKSPVYMFRMLLDPCLSLPKSNLPPCTIIHEFHFQHSFVGNFCQNCSTFLNQFRDTLSTIVIVTSSRLHLGRRGQSTKTSTVRLALTRSFFVCPLVYIETLSSTIELCVVPDTHQKIKNLKPRSGLRFLRLDICAQLLAA